MKLSFPPGANVHVEMLMKDEDPHEYLMRTIEVELDGNGWDQPAKIFLVGIAQGVGFLCNELPGPPGVMAYPPFGVKAFAEALGNDEEIRNHYKEHSLLPNNFYGLIVSTEAWKLPAFDPEQPSDKRGEWLQAAKDNAIDEHPDRIEERLVVGIFANGGLAVVQRERGQIPGYGFYPDASQGKHPFIEVGGLVEAMVDFAIVLHDICDRDPNL